MPGAVAYGEVAEGGGEEPGGEGVARADGGDDVDVQGGDGGDGVRRRAAARPAGPGEDGDAVGAALDDQDVGFGQGGADRPGAVDAPGLLGLVLADEDEVAAAGEVEQDLGARLAVAPEAGAVVDVEGDQGAAFAGCGEVAEEGQAVGGERGGDAGEVQDAGVEEVLVRHVLRGHRRGRGATR